MLLKGILRLGMTGGKGSKATRPTIDGELGGNEISLTSELETAEIPKNEFFKERFPG